jgi:predicted nucleic acid-binding protein
MDTGRPEMKIVLDASMALAWHLYREDRNEAALAQKALQSIRVHGALVPVLWYPEVSNTLLAAERRRVATEQDTANFLADVAQLALIMDSTSPHATQPSVLAMGRASQLSGYDATYLELAKRNGAQLATFDRKLAEAARAVGVRVFGDPV